MNIHEYQAKEILKKYGVAVPECIVVETADEAVNAAKKIQEKTGTKAWVVKAQIHAGGRGKGGGVKVALNLDKVKEHASNIIGMTLITPQTGAEGKLVKKVLITEDTYYPGESETKEYYLSILLDRSTGCNMIMYSTQGGMDIETVAAQTPHLIFKEEVNPALGLMAYQARRIAFNLNVEEKAFKSMVNFVTSLYNAFIKSDASLIEINPLFKTSDHKVVAVDAKVSLEDNALIRHSEYLDYRDLTEENPFEVEASEYNLNFIKLDGNVGCMVNGAGLAMATMDIIKLSGGNPANFLDVGGTASATTVEAGFRIILKDPKVQAILVNIFGGIVRCDRVAQGIVDACKSIGDIKIPVIVRLQGTNAEEAKKLIDNSGLHVFSAITLQDAADLVTKIVK
jgi:succinyl-CoA synthetase beta subunit